MIELGIFLALACALATNISFLCRHRGAVAAPQVTLRHPLRSVAGLFRSRWWTIGFAIAFGAWTLHVAALAVAPISVVQAVISGGLVLLAYPAERWFGFRLNRRQWIGLGLAAVGLALLGVTLESSGAHARYSVSAMISFEAAAIAVGAALLLHSATSEPHPRQGVMLGAGAGLLFGVSDIAIKALTGTVPGDVLSIISPWTAVALVASVLAFFALARGLQLGEGISVIAISSVAANCAAILGGILVFGDPLGADLLGIIARGAAFAAVVIAAVLMPGPLRAAHARA